MLSTYNAPVGAAASIAKTLRPVLSSSIKNRFLPLFVVSFAPIDQSFEGKSPAEVSSNLIRKLFSFSLIVVKPKVSHETQSVPTHRLPWMMTSVVKSWAFKPLIATMIAAQLR
jgi:hypothetical protein